MRLQQYILGLFILFIVFACENNNVEIDPNYPTIVSEISVARTDEILNQLAQSPMYSCMLIDTFGFPFFDIEYDSMCIDQDWRIDNSYEEIEARSQSALYDYADLLNINNRDAITINSITTSKGIPYSQLKTLYPDSLPNTWLVTTQQQKYNNISVRGSSLQVLLSPENVIGIKGHWYNFIYIPDVEKFTEQGAKESIYNKSFKYNSSEIIPSESITWHASRKLIVPLRRSDHQIELHVCWALYPTSWEIIVDCETGEVISSIDINRI